jgi:sugar O-acyltransferase (sialic acid O-acetyltransferase NeuD family)
MDKIIVIGGGGHAKVVIDALLASGKYKIAAVLDPALRKGAEVLGVKVAGGDNELPRFFRSGVKNCIIAIGSVGDISQRGKLYLKAEETGFNFPVLIHPKAIVSKYSCLGDGTFVAAGAVVNAGAVVGINCIINTGAVVEHDCRLGDFVHISPNATLCGNVTVNDGAHVGAGSTVIEGLSIGKNALIGAGSMVAGNVGDGWLCYGVPARKKEKR